MSASKLTTAAACRVARIDRDRFNEHVAAGRFPCAPGTIPGRSRVFDPDDMIALWLFRELMDDGVDAAHAGTIACRVALAARLNPEAPAISFVECYLRTHGEAWLAHEVPHSSEWDSRELADRDIRKVTTFRIGKIRRMIAHATEEEKNIVGERD